MTENIESLILEHLRAIHTDIASIKQELGDVKLRLSSLEEHVGGMRRDMSLFMAT